MKTGLRQLRGFSRRPAKCCQIPGSKIGPRNIGEGTGVLRVRVQGIWAAIAVKARLLPMLSRPLHTISFSPNQYHVIDSVRILRGSQVKPQIYFFTCALPCAGQVLCSGSYGVEKLREFYVLSDKASRRLQEFYVWRPWRRQICESSTFGDHDDVRFATVIRLETMATSDLREFYVWRP